MGFNANSVRPNKVYKVLSAAATVNGANVWAGPCNLHKLKLKVVKAASVFVHFYDKATAPVVGTDVPILTLELATATYQDLDMQGLSFLLGLGVSFTGAIADNDATALVAGDFTGLYLGFAA